MNHIDTAPCLYLTCNDEGTISFVNKTLESTLKFSAGELVDASINVLFPVATKIFYSTHAFPLLKLRGAISEIFMFLRASDGTQVPTLVNATRDEGDKPIIRFVAVLVDNRNKYEEELIAARNEAQRLAADNTQLTTAEAKIRLQTAELDQALSGLKRQHEELRQLNKIVTHDLEEPLRKVFLYLNTFKATFNDPENRGNLDKIARAATTLKKTLQALQEYVWLGDRELEAETLELDVLVRRVAERVRLEFPAAKANWDIEVLSSITGDDKLLSDVFYHLLKNAVQYGPADEVNEIKVFAALITQNVFRQTLGSYEFASFMRVSVQDRGIGFPGDSENALIDIQLFRRWSEPTGIGLGLALSRKIAELHGGWLTVSRMPAGSRIDVFLPHDQAKNDSARG